VPEALGLSLSPLRIIVIGGGAAGFFGAIACAEANPQAQVTLLEAGRQLLAKVRISGGGRCNVTHACFDPALLVQHYPRGGKALRGAFTRFHPRHTVDWFAAHKVKLKTETDGRMFPSTDDSTTIVNCLINSAEKAGVEIRTGAAVTTVTRSSEGKSAAQIKFAVHLKSQQTLSCDRLLLATGSSPQGFRLAAALGHQIEPPVPSLFTFNIPDSRLQDLAGVAVTAARLRLQVNNSQLLEQTGPLLITHWGLSGPAILKLSAWGARALHDADYQATLIINWLPEYNPEALRQQLLVIKSQLSRRAIASSCPLLLPQRLWQRLIASTGIDTEKRWAELSNKALNQLIQELTQGRYQVKGKGVFKEEFVTCGGVNLKEVDFKTMESRRCPGLYFAGEILNIDGVTGGFNFQSAWTTAWLAGQAMGN
jgi:hypothetical protein